MSVMSKVCHIFIRINRDKQGEALAALAASAFTIDGSQDYLDDCEYLSDVLSLLGYGTTDVFEGDESCFDDIEEHNLLDSAHETINITGYDLGGDIYRNHDPDDFWTVLAPFVLPCSSMLVRTEYTEYNFFYFSRKKLRKQQFLDPAF